MESVSLRCDSKGIIFREKKLVWDYVLRIDNIDKENKEFHEIEIFGKWTLRLELEAIEKCPFLMYSCKILWAT